MAPCAMKKAVLSLLGFLLHATDAYRFEEDNLMDEADVVNVSSTSRTSYESLLELKNPMEKVDFDNLQNLADYYKDMKRFDAGAFGTVFTATDIATQEAVVVKEIPREKYSSAEDEVMGLGLPFVAESIKKDGNSKYKSGDKVALVMRKYKESAIHMKTAWETHWKSWGEQIAYGLWMLHRKGWLYGDLKLDNTFITDEGKDENVVLADFGTAIKCGRPRLHVPY
eukprot:TRINITY_DN7935_c0_g1_i1.p1 TRINITY_DN7935_c0_g1~~TRINITY_DN7935_c0_g1_i1.p1  ORF type:complete len:225 (+),score=41.11 TRINITY_DN7935_c0_g1_i1:55-729(+)